MKNKKMFKEYMSLLAEKYEKTISEVMAKTIWAALEQFPDKSCEKAFQSVFAHGRFYKDILPDLLEQLGQSTTDRAVHAWVKVDKAVRELGPYQSVAFDDPVIHRVIMSMGGWPEFQDVDLYEWKFKRKEFERLYAIMEKGPGKTVGYLPGITEINNLALGYDKYIPIPICIGVQVKALKAPERRE